MKIYGIDVYVKNVPVLDKHFIPIGKFNEAFLKTAKQPVGIAVERNDSLTARYDTFIHDTPEMLNADIYYMDRLVKTVLWQKGGFKIYVSGQQGNLRPPEKSVYARRQQTVRCACNVSFILQ